MNQPQRKKVMRLWTGCVGCGSWSAPVSALRTRLNTPIKYLNAENEPEMLRDYYHFFSTQSVSELSSALLCNRNPNRILKMTLAE